MGTGARTNWRSVCIMAVLSALLVSSIAFAGTPAGAGAGPSAVESSQATTTDGLSLSADTEQPQEGALYQDPDADVTVTRVKLSENGSAVWELTIRTRLESDSEVEEYEAFQEEFRANRSQYVGEFEDRMRGVVDNAQVATEREMTARSFEGETGIQEVPRQWGYVTYRFSWEGLAASDGDSITVGDVFEGGYFLEEDDILVIAYPEGYEPADSTPPADESENGELQWNGPAEFEDQRPSVQFEAVSTSGDGAGATDGGNGGILGPIGLLIIVVLALFTAVGAYVYRSDQLPDAPFGDVPEETDRPTAASEQTAGGASGNGPTVERDPEHEADKAVEEHEPEGFEEADPQSSGEPNDQQGQELDLGALATDEDRVIALLEAEGGRMRQAAIGDYFGWSASKTSRVLSDMENGEQVEKLRIGRENVIDLPEADKGLDD